MIWNSTTRPECFKPLSPKIVRIDNGTVYDCAGKLENLVSDIRSGKWGSVSDVVVGIRYNLGDGRRVVGNHYGTGNPETAIAICEYVKRDLVG